MFRVDFPLFLDMIAIYLFSTRLRSFSLTMPANLVGCLSANASTCRARLYFFMSTSPITRNGGKLFQQVLIAHDPLTPWHLQSVRSRFFTIWSNDKMIKWWNGSNGSIDCDLFVALYHKCVAQLMNSFNLCFLEGLWHEQWTLDGEMHRMQEQA